MDIFLKVFSETTWFRIMKSLTILSFLWKCYKLWWLPPGVCELCSLLAILWSNVRTCMTSFGTNNLSCLKLYIIKRKFKFCYEYTIYFISLSEKMYISFVASPLIFRYTHSFQKFEYPLCIHKLHYLNYIGPCCRYISISCYLAIHQCSPSGSYVYSRIQHPGTMPDWLTLEL